MHMYGSEGGHQGREAQQSLFVESVQLAEHEPLAQSVHAALQRAHHRRFPLQNVLLDSS